MLYYYFLSNSSVIFSIVQVTKTGTEVGNLLDILIVIQFLNELAYTSKNANISFC